MIQDYFKQFKKIEDKINPFCDCYLINEEARFYIEPVFYTQLNGFLERHPNDFIKIINKMIEVANKNKHVVFVGNFEFPQTVVDDSYIYLEINDITDPLNIYVEDKSRGSDYGD